LSPKGSGGRKQQAMKTGVIYLARALLTLAIVVAALLLSLKGPYTVVWNGNYLIAAISQLDIFHHLFYAWVLVVIFTVPLTCGLIPGAKSSRLAIRLAAAALVAVPPGAFLVAAVYLARPRMPWRFHVLFGAIYVALNLLIFAAGADRERWNKILRRLALLADLALPLPVWGAYRARNKGFRFGLQLIPLGLLATVSFLPWLARPVAENEAFLDPHSAFRHVGLQDLYQIVIDPQDGQYLVTDSADRLCRIDPVNGETLRCTNIKPVYDCVQSFGYDHQRRELIYVEPCLGHTFVLDETDLRIKRIVPITAYHPQKPERCAAADRRSNRTRWATESGILICTTYDPGFLLLNPDGDQVLFDTGVYGGSNSSICCATKDALIDPRNRKVHWLTVSPAVGEFDVDRRKLDRVLALPSTPERLALDAKRNRLLITLPILGEVMVVDLQSYQPIATINSFPGVRVVTVDPERDVLYLGGLSPVFEIRSLADYTLQDRIVAPPWQRWIDVDNPRNKVAVSAHYGGPWELDLKKLREDKDGAFRRRIDPAYAVFHALARLARQLILLTKPLHDAFA
jgi:hypothetical protein